MGGFGPLAGAHFYRRLVELTPATGDEGHLAVVFLSEPNVPSRIRHLLGEGPTPVPALTRIAKALEQAGADTIAIPSATVHAYHNDIQAAVSIPVLHLPQLVMAAVERAGARRVALLATTPTVRLGLYAEPAQERHLAVLTPDGASQDQVMDVISFVKAGGDPSRAASRLTDLTKGAWATGADIFLLGCTELPAVYPHALRPPGTLDATDELARGVLRAFGYAPKDAPSGAGGGPNHADQNGHGLATPAQGGVVGRVLTSERKEMSDGSRQTAQPGG